MTSINLIIKNYLDPERVAMLDSISLKAKMVVEGYIIGQVKVHIMDLALSLQT